MKQRIRRRKMIQQLAVFALAATWPTANGNAAQSTKAKELREERRPDGSVAYHDRQGRLRKIVDPRSNESTFQYRDK